MDNNPNAYQRIKVKKRVRNKVQKKNLKLTSTSLKFNKKKLSIYYEFFIKVKIKT